MCNATATRFKIANYLKLSFSMQGTPFALEKYDLGFDTGDYVLNNAGRALRLLHAKELRELQTRINEAIVAVQSVTANPRVDERLGKVGF